MITAVKIPITDLTPERAKLDPDWLTSSQQLITNEWTTIMRF